MNSKPNPLAAASVEDVAGVDMAETAGPDAAPLNAEQEDALREALEELADLDAYADEKGLPPPAPTAKQAVREFLCKAVREVPRYYAVSPWAEGKAVVHTRGAKGFGVAVYFNAEGGASCYVVHPRDTQCKERHYPQARQAANEWVFDALRALEG